jgi:hypothetical protein
MGMPTRVANIPLNPTLNSPMFWDMISVAVWAIGALIVTALYRIALATREEVEA